MATISQMQKMIQDLSAENRKLKILVAAMSEESPRCKELASMADLSDVEKAPPSEAEMKNMLAQAPTKESKTQDVPLSTKKSTEPSGDDYGGDYDDDDSDD